MNGGINLFMWIGYIISIALYAQGFAAYFMTFFTTTPTHILSKSVASAIVVLFTAINILGAKSVGKAEIIIVLIKLIILISFAVIGLFFIHPANLSPAHWSNITFFDLAGVAMMGAAQRNPSFCSRLFFA